MPSAPFIQFDINKQASALGVSLQIDDRYDFRILVVRVSLPNTTTKVFIRGRARKSEMKEGNMREGERMERGGRRCKK